MGVGAAAGKEKGARQRGSEAATEIKWGRAQELGSKKVTEGMPSCEPQCGQQPSSWLTRIHAQDTLRAHTKHRICTGHAKAVQQSTQPTLQLCVWGLPANGE